MIDLAISVATPLPKGAPAPAARAATEGFETTLAALGAAAPVAAPVTADGCMLLPGGDAITVAEAGVAPAPISTPLAPPPLPMSPPAPPAPPVAMPVAVAVPIAAAACADANADRALLLPGLPARRQALADDGKPLPAEAPEDDLSKNIIWLPVGMIALHPAPGAPPALPRAIPMVMPAAVEGAVPPATAPAASTAPLVPTAPTEPIGVSIGGKAEAAAPLAQDRIVAPALALAPATIPVAVAPVSVAAAPIGPGSSQDLAAPAVVVDQPIRADPAVAPPSPDVPQPVARPAGLAFAAAIAAAQMPVRRSRDDGDAVGTGAPLAIAAPAPEAGRTLAVSPPADARQTALDLRQDSGLQRMIDRIELLRDDADSRNTRIRLVPDALGAVDISMRRDGERVHVHFSAENQASARLLTDAQPRLAELAEARGLKLGQTSVDSGTGTNDAPRQWRFAQPPSASAPAGVVNSETTADTDIRIA